MKDHNTAIRRLRYLENLLVRAAKGHDGDWNWEELGDPANCSQCNYDGMKEVLAEGRRINEKRKK